MDARLRRLRYTAGSLREIYAQSVREGETRAVVRCAVSFGIDGALVLFRGSSIVSLSLGIDDFLKVSREGQMKLLAI